MEGRAGGRFPRVAVLAWDAGHNPLGRAYVLAELLRDHFDVEIRGAQFRRYGSRIWAPLRHSAIPIRTFPGDTFPAHLAVMDDVARDIDADAICISKPRLPSLALGVIASGMRRRPLVLDVDDDELAFFGHTAGLALDALDRRTAKADLSLPFGELWTRVCEPLIGATDALTVSNPAIQARYGGAIVPHARDERVFDPDRYDRAEMRRRLGVGESDRLLLFGGTARAHKGVVEVARALDRLGDERYRLAVLGSGDLGELRGAAGAAARWIMPLPFQPFEDLAALVGAADLACVLQDPAHPVSQSQMPAKVTDALAMAVPCLVSPVPPLRDLIDREVVFAHADTVPLEDTIRAVFDGDAGRERAARGRAVFLDELSYAAVRPGVIARFEQLLDDPPAPADARLTALDTTLHRLFPPGDRASTPARRARVPGSGRGPASPAATLDLVVFWKQNDSSLYGRRQDMLVDRLVRSGRFRTVLHFDKPMSAEALVHALVASRGRSDQRRRVALQTVARVLHLRDRKTVKYRTCIVAGRWTAKLGLRRPDAHVQYVETTMRRYGFGARPTVVLAYPTNDDLPSLIDVIAPDLVVADVVDDARTWHAATSQHYRQWNAEGSPEYDRIDLNYEEVLARSDVVLANCAPVAESMREFAPTVHVVPNACDLSPLPLRVRGRHPRELRGLQGPIVGYVGNLSSRIDIDLVEAVARARPGWQYVFVGSAHIDRDILRLDALANVHFLGVKSYARTRALVRHFDVGIVPHLANEMTRAMNPLKAYVYCAEGVPVVSTPIDNLGELRELVAVADGPDQFVSAIEDALRAGRRAPDGDRLRPYSWEARVEQIMRLVDSAFTASTASD